MFGHPDTNATNGGQPVAAPQPGSTPPVTPAAASTNSPAVSSGAPAVNDDLLGDFIMDDPKKPDAGTPSVSPGRPAVNPGQDDLLSIKQQALQQLSPLVDHLDQSPEEKFRTTMMLIQAADNQSLIKDAYEAAEKISDEKARAQALLDVVNEINYFTQPHDDKEDQPA